MNQRFTNLFSFLKVALDWDSELAVSSNCLVARLCAFLRVLEYM